MSVTTAEAQVVRWQRKPGGRWSYGRWSGLRGADGSLTVTEFASQSQAALAVRPERSRALRPELVQVAKGKSWIAVATTEAATAQLDKLDEAQASADAATASPEVGTSREGLRVTFVTSTGRRYGRVIHRDDAGAVVEFPNGATVNVHHADLTYVDERGRTLPDPAFSDVYRWHDALTAERQRRSELVDPMTWAMRELVAFASLMTWSGWHPDPHGVASGSELVAALETARAGVRAEFPELLDAVMITGSGLSARGVTWGHFRREAWRDALASGRRPEIFIGAERLATGAVLTMQTILHEAAHELAFVREIQDTSRQHRYHNGQFLAIAAELGLTYTHDGPDSTIGYSAVTLTTEGRKRWQNEITALHDAITLMGDDPTRWLSSGSSGGAGGGHGVALPPGMRRAPRGGSSYVRLTCACPYTIRAAASTVDATSITCNTCSEEFTP